MSGSLITGVTLSGSLTGIVNSIRTKSYTYWLGDGVCKKLVTPVGVGQKGNKVTEPYRDPTAESPVTATEGYDFTSWDKVLPTTKDYTSTEKVYGTLLTYNDIEDASESMMDQHASEHAMIQAHALEVKICAVFGSFTTNKIVATNATTGLTIAKVAAAKTLVAGQLAVFRPPYALVLTENVWYKLFNNLTQQSNYGPMGSLGDSVLDTYYKGTVLGDINVFRTNGITTAATVRCGLFTKEAIGLYVPRSYTFKTQEDISKRAYELVSSMRAGARVRLIKAGTRVLTAGANPS